MNEAKRRAMQRLAFVASFLAVFITADNELFGGAMTRYSRDVVNGVARDARDAQVKITTWLRRH